MYSKTHKLNKATADFNRNRSLSKIGEKIKLEAKNFAITQKIDKKRSLL